MWNERPVLDTRSSLDKSRDCKSCKWRKSRRERGGKVHRERESGGMCEATREREKRRDRVGEEKNERKEEKIEI